MPYNGAPMRIRYNGGFAGINSFDIMVGSSFYIYNAISVEMIMFKQTTKFSIFNQK